MDAMRRRLLIAGASLTGACALPARQSLGPPAAASAPRRARDGDRWRYAQINGYNRLDDAQLTISMRTDTGRQVYEWRGPDGLLIGTEIQDPQGRLLQEAAFGRPEPRFEAPLVVLPSPLAPAPGILTRTRYRMPGDSAAYPWDDWVRPLGWERISVPAGQFDCLRIERLIRFAHPDFARLDPTRYDTLWHAPEIGRWVRREWQGEYFLPEENGRTRLEEDARRWELSGFEPAPVS